MPVIITATDFSDIGENAVNYACALAKAQGANVVIIHSFIVPVMFSDIPMPGTLITDAEKDAEDQMKKLVERIAGSYPGVNIEGRVIFGNTADALEEYAEEHDHPWLIVVGNASPDEISTWPDSTLMDTFRKMAYPVLAVPKAAVYKPIQNICFAFDNKHTGNAPAIEQVVAFSKQLNASVHILNIQQEKQDIDSDAQRQLSDVNPKYHFIYGPDNVNGSIQNFINTNNIDWLIMIPRKHSFFEGLFHKSHTKAVAHHSHIPILAIHEAQS